MNKDLTQKLLFPTVLSMAGDPVANVRFNVAKTIKKLGPVLDQSVIQGQVRPCLQKLKTDADIDVQFFAIEAQEVLKLS